MTTERPSQRDPVTLFDLRGPTDRRSQWRRFPELVAEALRLVWRASPRHFVTSVVLQIGSAAALALQLLIGRDVLQDLVSSSGGGVVGRSLLIQMGLLVGMTVLLGAMGALVSYQQRYLTEMVGRHAFDRIIDVATAVDLASFEDAEFFDQLTRARISGLSKPVEMVNGVSTLLMALLTSVGIGIALMTMHPLLLPLVIVSAIPVFIATIRNSREAYEFEYAWTPRSRERAYLMELFTGKDSAKEIRVFGATPFLRHRYNILTDERLSKLGEFLRRRLGVAMAGTVGGAIGAALALSALGWLVVTGRIDVATAVAAGVAMQLLIARFTAATKSLGSLVEAGMFLDDYRTFLALGSALVKPHVDDHAPPAHGERVHRPFEGLKVEDVTFTYPKSHAVVLEDVSLEVGPGEVVALVGENGSGKTTLVKLICQLYRPQEGSILWNGMDVRSLDHRELMSDITVLFQDFLHYHLTALENIAIGRVERPPDDHHVASAAQQAGAHGFITRLPQGYGTQLGRQFYGGHELSVGQWQRLALARAFFRDGSFLILDEPTASLDPRAEHDLFMQMRVLCEGRSVLLVSHRFSSVRHADRIYVLQGGRVIEKGSHEELLSLDGQYAELFRLQAAAYLDEDPQRLATNAGSSADLRG